MEQLSLKEEIRELILDLKAYLETRYDLARLGLVESVAGTVSAIITALVVSILGFTLLLFISIGLAYFLGEMWDSQALGFWAVGGGYFALVLLVLLLRRSLILSPIVRLLLKVVLPEKK